MQRVSGDIPYIFLDISEILWGIFSGVFTSLGIFLIVFLWGIFRRLVGFGVLEYFLLNMLVSQFWAVSMLVGSPRSIFRL